MPVSGAFLAVGCLLLAAVSVAVQFSPHGYLSNEDSWGPMNAAIALRGTPAADHMYETLFFEQHVKFQYPPTSLLPLEALRAVGLGSSRALNMLNAGLAATNAALMGLLALSLFPRREGDRLWTRAALWGLGAAAALAFYPIARGLELGQIQVWLDLVFTAACVLLARGWPGAAGAAMGFASLIKPQFLPLLLFAAISRRWRFIGGFLTLAAPLGLVSLWRYGLHDHLEYPAVLSFIGRHGEAFYSNNSINGIANRLLGNGSNLDWTSDGFAPFHPAVFAATSAGALVFFAIPLLLRPARDDRAGILLHLCLATLCLIMASPVAWEHHYGVMPPMFIVIAWHLVHAPAGPWRRVQAVAVAVAWLLCASELAPVANRLSGSVLNPLQATHFFGAALLLIVMGWVLRARGLLRRGASRVATGPEVASVAAQVVG